MSYKFPNMSDPEKSLWDVVHDMPSEVKIGQCLMVGFEGTELPQTLAVMLAEGLIGGVILFRRNIKDPAQLRDLCAEIHESSPECPPLISIDQEGGLVTRFSPPFTMWPFMNKVGKTDPDQAWQLGLAMGREMAAVGIDIDFAPVMDVNTNPDNPIIGVRAFGDNPELVIEMGMAVMKGLNEAGIIPCAKHFPGHGDTSLDSHKELPVVERSMPDLKAIDLSPFRHAIENNCPMIMTAHVLYPALDRYYPATVSHRIISDLLRDEWGYDGVIITDAMEMEGINSIMPPIDAAFNAIKAGCDILLYGESSSVVEEVREHLIVAQQRAALMPQEVDQAVHRVLRLKRDRLINPPPQTDSSWIGHPDHAELSNSFS